MSVLESDLLHRPTTQWKMIELRGNKLISLISLIKHCPLVHFAHISPAMSAFVCVYLLIYLLIYLPLYLSVCHARLIF